MRWCSGGHDPGVPYLASLAADSRPFRPGRFLARRPRWRPSSNRWRPTSGSGVASGGPTHPTSTAPTRPVGDGGGDRPRPRADPRPRRRGAVRRVVGGRRPPPPIGRCCAGWDRSSPSRPLGAPSDCHLLPPARRRPSDERGGLSSTTRSTSPAVSCQRAACGVSDPRPRGRARRTVGRPRCDRSRRHVTNGAVIVRVGEPSPPEWSHFTAGSKRTPRAGADGREEYLSADNRPRRTAPRSRSIGLMVPTGHPRVRPGATAIHLVALAPGSRDPAPRALPRPWASRAPGCWVTCWPTRSRSAPHLALRDVSPTQLRVAGGPLDLDGGRPVGTGSRDRAPGDRQAPDPGALGSARGDRRGRPTPGAQPRGAPGGLPD